MQFALTVLLLSVAAALAVPTETVKEAPTLSRRLAPIGSVWPLWQFAVGTHAENIALASFLKILITTPSNDSIAYFPTTSAPLNAAENLPSSVVPYGIATLHENVTGVLAPRGKGLDIEPGTFSLYSLNFTASNDPETKKIVDLPSVDVANHMAIVNERWLLISDSGAGKLVRVDLKTTSVLDLPWDPLFAAPPGEKTGLNGIAVTPDNCTLYFANSGAKAIGKLPLRPDAFPAGRAEKLAAVESCDDVAVFSNGTIYVAGGSTNSIYRISPEGDVGTLAGAKDSLLVPHPTSCKFGWGEDEGTLFITTTGGVYNGTARGSQMISVRVAYPS